jgi:hypothetical protein
MTNSREKYKALEARVISMDIEVECPYGHKIKLNHRAVVDADAFFRYIVWGCKKCSKERDQKIRYCATI